MVYWVHKPSKNMSAFTQEARGFKRFLRPPTPNPQPPWKQIITVKVNILFVLLMFKLNMIRFSRPIVTVLAPWKFLATGLHGLNSSINTRKYDEHLILVYQIKHNLIVCHWLKSYLVLLVLVIAKNTGFS